jgi:hypothetical protein
MVLMVVAVGPGELDSVMLLLSVAVALVWSVATWVGSGWWLEDCVRLSSAAVLRYSLGM